MTTTDNLHGHEVEGVERFPVCDQCFGAVEWVDPEDGATKGHWRHLGLPPKTTAKTVRIDANRNTL